ncbi:MAG: DUF1670 domain-containing protein [Nitrospiraceae bacterium]|nr:DUF1670 domain-containing protein [Nitrospiraceae bacterium]
MEFGKVEYRCVVQKNGKPFFRTLHLTLIGLEDKKLLSKKGVRALRLNRIMRLTAEAMEQGCPLGYEDLSNLLMTSLATLKRDVTYLESQDTKVLIRGRRNGRKSPDAAIFCHAAKEVGA